MANPWDRQSNETAKAFQAFNQYLTTGSIRTAYRQLPGKSAATAAPGTWTGWSTKHDWVKRRVAWIEHTTRMRQEATQAEQMQISQNLTACRLALTETALKLLKTGDSRDFLRAARAFTLQHPPVQRAEDVSERFEDLSDLPDEALNRMREIRDDARKKIQNNHEN